MSRLLSCLALSLAMLATAAFPASAQSDGGHDRPRATKAAQPASKPALPRNAAPHWSSISRDGGHVSRPEATRTILVPRGGRLDVVHVPVRPRASASTGDAFGN